MLVTMGQFRAITSSGVTPDTAITAIGAWLARRPLETQRVLSREIGSQAATSVVAALTKREACGS